MDIYEVIIKRLSDRLGVNPDELDPEMTIDSLGLDSLDLVECLMDLETLLGKELEMTSKPVTLNDFVLLVKKNIADKEDN